MTRPDSTPSLSWQALRRARDATAANWPSALKLPLVKRPSDVLYPQLSDTSRVLDVGAGDGQRRERIARRFPNARYVSVDPDPEANADHLSLDSVTTKFDMAILFEVLEHLPPEDGIALLTRMHQHLEPGGQVVVSVPATHTPGRYLRDCTHVTPWAHDELGAALTLAGFQLQSLHRSYPGPAVQRTWRRLVLGPIGHLFGVDYAHSVIALGSR